MWTRFLVPACLLWVLGSCQQPTCHDIDPNACTLLHASRPDLCSDATLAQSACPRFCKLCPIECFSCSDVLQNFTLCNSTRQCAKEEICMLKTMKSFTDGHMEYHMTCEPKEHCDGQGLTFPFGRRDIESRDIRVDCCDRDFCNYPTTISAALYNPCNSSKDIIVLVDKSAAANITENFSVISFIYHVVDPLHISTTNSLVGLYTYDVSLQKEFGLLDHPDSASLRRALLTYRSSGNFSLERPDGNSGIEYLVQNVLTPKEGDRPDYADVILIIADAATANSFHLSLNNQRELGNLSHDVILVAVGGAPITNGNSVATDANHVISVPSYDELKNNVTIATAVFNLITLC